MRFVIFMKLPFKGLTKPYEIEQVDCCWEYRLSWAGLSFVYNLTVTLQQSSWLLSGSQNYSEPHSKWALSSSSTLQNNTRIRLILRLDEMGLHHPITNWCLNGKHTSIKPCRGGDAFVFTPPREVAAVGEGSGGWVASWINMALKCVIIPAPLHNTYSPFWLASSKPD